MNAEKVVCDDRGTAKIRKRRRSCSSVFSICREGEKETTESSILLDSHGGFSPIR